MFETASMKEQEFAERMLRLLPAYDDPEWEARPDDLRCDVDFARELLTKKLKNQPNAEGNPCPWCGNKFNEPRDLNHA